MLADVPFLVLKQRPSGHWGWESAVFSFCTTFLKWTHISETALGKFTGQKLKVVIINDSSWSSCYLQNSFFLLRRPAVSPWNLQQSSRNRHIYLWFLMRLKVLSQHMTADVAVLWGLKASRKPLQPSWHFLCHLEARRETVSNKAGKVEGIEYQKK